MYSNQLGSTHNPHRGNKHSSASYIAAHLPLPSVLDLPLLFVTEMAPTTSSGHTTPDSEPESILPTKLQLIAPTRLCRV